MEDGALKQGVISQIKGVYIIYTPLMCLKFGRFPTQSFLIKFDYETTLPIQQSGTKQSLYQVIYWMLKKERPIPSL